MTGRNRHGYRFTVVRIPLSIATSNALAPTRGSHVFLAPFTGAFIALRLSHN